MKKVSKILNLMEAILNGSLDGLELDNTCDVIEKSLVIEMVNDLKTLVTKARTEVKNITTEQSICPKCNFKPMININKKYKCEMCGYDTQMLEANFISSDLPVIKSFCDCKDNGYWKTTNGIKHCTYCILPVKQTVL